jgi:protein SCO1
MHPIVFLRISDLFLFLAMFGCSQVSQQDALPYYNTPDFTPSFFTDSKSAELKIDHTIGRFSFHDQHGDAVTDQDIEGKIHVASFMFTSCISICPVMTKNMKVLQREFRGNPHVQMLSYSVTPWIDSVGRLREYAIENDIVAPNWHLLTGNRAQVYALARQSYFAEEDLGFTKDSTEFLHTEHVILVDKSKRIRGIYNGTLELEILQLADDIRTLIASETADRSNKSKLN